MTLRTFAATPSDPVGPPLAGGGAGTCSIGGSISHYRLIAKLGEGRTGVVYRAEDTELRRPVAVKILYEKWVSDRRRLSRFLKGARAAAVLNHPHICTIHEIGRQGAVPFLVMELLEGQTLEQMMRAGRLEMGTAVRLATQMAEALAAAHAEGIVHGHLEPANIFIVRANHAKLADFGLATWVQPGRCVGSEVRGFGPEPIARTRADSPIGRGAYVSPEQVQYRKFDGRADIFALGCVLYEMLSGERAFGGSSNAAALERVLDDEPVPLEILNPEVSFELEQVVSRTLEKVPGRRYQTAAELAAELRREPSIQPTPEASVRAHRRARTANRGKPRRRLGRFRIVEPLGRGGGRQVYVAEDPEQRRLVALKVLPVTGTASPEFLQRFRRRARALTAVSHPNVVAIHSLEEADGLHFLSMELVGGVGLDQHLPPRGMRLDSLLSVAWQIADALETMHTRGITHRNLSSNKVMLSSDGGVKVLDFGLAELLEPDSADGARGSFERFMASGPVLETPEYMSPERVLGIAVDQRTDIFSLGVLLYEMATGRRPFEAEGWAPLITAILRDEPSALEGLRPGLPPELCRIVRRCLEKDLTRRFRTSAQVRDRLAAIT